MRTRVPLIITNTCSGFISETCVVISINGVGSSTPNAALLIVHSNSVCRIGNPVAEDEQLTVPQHFLYDFIGLFLYVFEPFRTGCFVLAEVTALDLFGRGGVLQGAYDSRLTSHFNLSAGTETGVVQPSGIKKRETHLAVAFA